MGCAPGGDYMERQRARPAPERPDLDAIEQQHRAFAEYIRSGGTIAKMSIWSAYDARVPALVAYIRHLEGR